MFRASPSRTMRTPNNVADNQHARGMLISEIKNIDFKHRHNEFHTTFLEYHEAAELQNKGIIRSRTSRLDQLRRNTR